MDFDQKYRRFLQRVMQRPIPTNAMARMHVLAKELAEGASEELWNMQIDFARSKANEDLAHILTFSSIALTNYLQQRWNEEHPSWELLVHNGYLYRLNTGFRIEPKAFELISEVETPFVFISYRRKDSSAFALLALARLKEFGVNAFLDMSLQPGDNWHAYIKEQIQLHDYFILLLGKETLESSVVRDEISWAIEAGAEIIPIWHNGFEYRDGAFNLPPEIQRVLRSNHSIRVLEESALAYNNAIVELLNRFGITP